MWMLNIKRMEVRWLSFNKRNWCSYERLTDGMLNWHHPREPILSSDRGISNTPRFWQTYSDFSFNMGPRARISVWRTPFPCSLAQSHCKLFNLLLTPHFQINVQISNRWWWIWMARSTILAISEWFGELRKQLNQIDKSIILMKKLITSKWEPHIFKSVFALLCLRCGWLEIGWLHFIPHWKARHTPKLKSNDPTTIPPGINYAYLCKEIQLRDLWSC